MPEIFDYSALQDHYPAIEIHPLSFVTECQQVQLLGGVEDIKAFRAPWNDDASESSNSNLDEKHK